MHALLIFQDPKVQWHDTYEGMIRSIAPIAAVLLAYPLGASALSHPTLGRASKSSLSNQRKTNYYVMGTSHLRWGRSAKEVQSLIQEVDPDGVVVDLDPERVIRLSKEGSKHPDEEQLFGSDFLAAIDTARAKDIPLFIGDEYTKETRERFAESALDPSSYGPGKLAKALLSLFLPLPNKHSDDASCEYISLWRVISADPMKFAPLVVTALPAFLSFIATMPSYRIDDVGNDAATLLSLLFSFFATCKVFNNFIVDRDDVLAANAVRAAKVISSLKTGETIRSRWTFSVNGNDAKSINNGWNEEKLRDLESTEDTRVPLFTLKTPLEVGSVRNLNLFEPRWLKMVDDVCSRPESTDEQSFGCVTCTNKFYSAIQIDGSEGRYADVIFRRRGTMAKIVDLVEGTRSVSGDRKVGVKIKGTEPFEVDEDKLAISKEGYLIASDIRKDADDAHTCNKAKAKEDGILDGEIAEKGSDDDDGGVGDDDEVINIVVVVGLLHANGVIERLSHYDDIR